MDRASLVHRSEDGRPGGQRGGQGDGESTTEFLDRDQIMVFNSPQALRYGYAKWVYAEGKRRGLIEKVEPHTTSLMLALGERVWFSKGLTSNIKITTPEDLRMFEGWVLYERVHAVGKGGDS